ncbi:hypothetical protein BD410DRAFT_155718 [Rickenella mellea]|uniref:Uncharacterized protein n=1 Tax=Rickenella mellea TaxID=50990 RepID=A0A4Y7PHZ9_9AGAM|nr:hypothetical protein BD410DRAFT_155718 [Rickenella mellea]
MIHRFTTGTCAVSSGNRPTSLVKDVRLRPDSDQTSSCPHAGRRQRRFKLFLNERWFQIGKAAARYRITCDGADISLRLHLLFRPTRLDDFKTVFSLLFPVNSSPRRSHGRGSRGSFRRLVALRAGLDSWIRTSRCSIWTNLRSQTASERLVPNRASFFTQLL